MGSKLDDYFFVKNPLARVLIVIVSGIITILVDVCIHFERVSSGFLEGVDPISTFIIQGFICIFIGLLFCFLFCFIFNFSIRFFKNWN
jgi:hypothetical protein